MKTVIFGPERDVPSWNWVGFDTSRELSKYFKVSSFLEYDEVLPANSVIFCIKQPPSTQFIDRQHRLNSKIIYCPIDYYLTVGMIKEHHQVLQKCDGILIHCNRLLPYLKQYNKNIDYVEHNNKYALPEMASYKKNGFILWIGGCQYLAYLMKHLKSYPSKYPIKILTDIKCDRARSSANILGSELGLSLKLTSSTTSVLNHECMQWNERLQFELMQDCKAAIDIKGCSNFNQLMKPPTKAQKYIASGIPFAINTDSYSTEYFLKYNFNICSPISEKWFTEAYWEQTQICGKKLRVDTSIESVGLFYKKIVDKQ